MYVYIVCVIPAGYPPGKKGSGFRKTECCKSVKHWTESSNVFAGHVTECRNPWKTGSYGHSIFWNVHVVFSFFPMVPDGYPQNTHRVLGILVKMKIKVFCPGAFTLGNALGAGRRGSLFPECPALGLYPTHSMLGFSSLVPPPSCCAFMYHDGTRKQGRELHLGLNQMKQKS
jgi:hypothetical protein